jgi:hypothetical protein
VKNENNIILYFSPIGTKATELNVLGRGSNRITGMLIARLIIEFSCINGNTLARDKHLQNNRNRSQKLSVASKLFAIVHLFPPSQCVIHPLIISKRSSLLPVEKVVCDLKQIFNEASNRNGKDSG